MEGAHDLGGLDGFGPVVTADGDLTHHEPWELRAQVLAMLGMRASMRPWIERLDPATYLGSSYYARWLGAGEDGLVASGHVTADALARWRSLFEADPAATPPTASDPERVAALQHALATPDRLPAAASPRFPVGATVRVRRWRDATTHHRCPRYVRGVIGVVEAIPGDEPIPGHEEERAAVYTVAFASNDLWGVGPEPPFTVLVDLSEPYLEAAT